MLELNDVMLEEVSGGRSVRINTTVQKNYAFVGDNFNEVKNGGLMIINISQTNK